MAMGWLRRVRQGWEDYVLANWQYKLAALGAALIFWAYVAGQQRTELVIIAPIEFKNIPVGSRVINQRVKLAEIVLTGRRERLLALRQPQVAVVLDLAGLRTGNNLYLISAADVTAPQGVEIKDITPHQINVQLVPEEPVP